MTSQQPTMVTITENATDASTNTPTKLTYTQRSMVGHGSFGEVHLINILPDNKKAAVKRVLQDKRFKNRELETMKMIKHKNIVNLLSYFYKTNEKDEVYLNLVLEYVPETLYTATYWYISRGKTMPSLEVKLYSYQLLRSLNYIHSLGICHRDIKPQNLLIDPINCTLKLCDFGSAKILNPLEPNVSYICSRYYRAPELIFGARNYTTKIDLWSAACVIAEMVLGHPLFPGQSGIDQLVEIIKLLGTPTRDEIEALNPNYIDHRFPLIKSIPFSKIFPQVEPQLCEFFKVVFKYSPSVRISAIQGMAHAYFDQLRGESFSNSTLPNFRGYNLVQPCKVPQLFDFSQRELSTCPDLWDTLIPEWRREELQMQSFTPLTSDQLQDPAIN
ncbi:uncharacterized protein C5L36_0A06310 [Pichia kudriavzevii]|uniref:Protein kinase gsk3 n=1 Tax=Pichia kudriavzevii TaxID=4909 RepID=A0A099NWR3_PICKU|nr:uncharacterized protein C5L36_0A06310 [Pichia kudriavzevii]AWU74037.1 hypothetical protein C5L36_0A06310 [Pichia kudriavzevii]KGK37263.1 hypothetical protein JL09_g3583 [Pichia kudriavzevii]ONH70306.1 Protein kinase gsk3 [Pichia kudriavzevii]ONH70487.1 Protein kinase gsk3 [Pichia kudriavzevii]ONH70848.1 Protein kinase gsk3 [Pichia kudriavzevii]